MDIDLTAKVALQVLARSHLAKGLTVSNNAQCYIEKELEALQEVGDNTSPVAEQSESDIALCDHQLKCQPRLCAAMART